MAQRKTEKDKKIEALEEVNRTLQRRNAWSEWVENLSERKKWWYASLLVLGVLLSVFFFTYQVMQVVKPIALTERSYELLLSEVDNRDWKIAKASLEALNQHVHGKPSGYAHTKRSGDTILLTLHGEMENLYRFSFVEGKVLGMFSSYPSVLSYSESTLKSGRALTLDVDQVKLVFYEEK